MIENQHTYHKVLSSAINELVYPFLAVFTSHACFNEELHQAWLMSKNCSLR